MNFSTGDLRIETDLAIKSGDALSIAVPGLMVLAEAVQSHHDGRHFTVGAKLYHSLTEADMTRCAQQFAFV